MNPLTCKIMVRSLEGMISMEQVARELWRTTTNGTDEGWLALPVLAKLAWRSRARIEVTIWRQRVGLP